MQSIDLIPTVPVINIILYNTLCQFNQNLESLNASKKCTLEGQEI